MIPELEKYSLWIIQWLSNNILKENQTTHKLLLNSHDIDTKLLRLIMK